MGAPICCALLNPINYHPAPVRANFILRLPPQIVMMLTLHVDAKMAVIESRPNL